MRWLRVSGETLRYAVLLLAGAITILPFAYMVVSSLKTNLEVLRVPMEWVPKQLHWDNYLLPMLEKPLGRYFLNSTIAASVVTLGQVITGAMAGYSLSKFRYAGRDVLFLTIISQLMIPLPVIMVPLFLVVKALGWVNSYQGLIVPVISHAFAVFMMRQFIAGVPDSYIEAARVDGAGEVTIFSRVILPLSKTGMVALAVFVFTGNWNEFLWPLLVINRENMYTLPIGIAFFEGMYSTNYPQLMATAVLSVLPTVAVFLALQRWLGEALMIAGLKG